jgi:hypothetical protein
MAIRRYSGESVNDGCLDMRALFSRNKNIYRHAGGLIYC